MEIVLKIPYQNDRDDYGLCKENLYFDIIQEAMADGLEEGDGEDMAGEAILQLVKEFMQGVGHLGDVSYGHGDKRW